MNFLIQLAIMIVLSIIAALLFRPSAPKAGPITAPTTDPTTPIPVLFGRALLGGNVIAFMGYRASPIHQSSVLGLVVTDVGNNYYAAMVVALCLGPVTKLWDIVADTGQRFSDIINVSTGVPTYTGSTFTGWTTTITRQAAVVFPGPQQLPYDVPTAAILSGDKAGDTEIALNAPHLYGGRTTGGGVIGPIHFFPGTRQQPASDFWSSFTLPSTPGVVYAIGAGGVVEIAVFFRPDINYITWAASTIGAPSDSDVLAGTLISAAPWTFEYSALSDGQTLFVGVIGYDANGTPSPLASFSVTFAGVAIDFTQGLAAGGVGGTIQAPNYPNLCYVVYENTILSQTPYPRPLAFEVSRTPVGFATSFPDDFFSGNRGDVNPISIIYELMTDRFWGIGLDDKELDLADPDGVVRGNSWPAASETLCDTSGTDQIFLSYVLSSQASAQEYIDDIYRTIDAVPFTHPVTGKLGIQLIRGDYDIGALPVYDESNLLDVDYTQASLTETVNEVRVIFTDRGRLYQSNQVKAQDLANAMAVGRVISTTVTYKGVTSEALALRLAQRDLRALSTPLSKATLTVNREGFDLHEGSPFLFSWARAGVAAQVMRVAKITRPGRNDSQLAVECIQDVFALPGTTAFTTSGVTWDNPSSGGVPAVPEVVVTMDTTAANGVAALQINDPDSRIVSVQFQHQSGRGAMSALTIAAAPYLDTVTLDPQYGSTISYVVTYAAPDGTLDTITNTVTFGVEQLPPHPALSFTIDGSGNVVVTATVASTVVSVKFADSSSAPPDDATTRAGVAVTGPFTYTPVASPLAAGAVDYVTAFAYDAAGVESAKAVLTIGAPTPPARAGSLDLVFEFGDGVTPPSATAIAGALELDFACTISRATIIGDTSGSAVVDIQTAAFANPPSFASIAASALPTLSSQTAVQDSTLTGWTTTIAAGSLVKAVLNSITTCKKITVTLTLTRT